MSVVAVWYIGLCIVVLLWGGVICRAEKGLVLWFFDVRRCGFAVFWVVGGVDGLCVAVFYVVANGSGGGENRLQGDAIKRRIIYIMYSLLS